eukprot:TRINITY_DN3665_c0_g1_i1.p1 TRINITY_DN3665_c0_g1~~TRINITY_DN3665_c0_g1_i1.p1  ORF type:complete len:142 (-),score=24.59 TRINITY_DN3665_c0_g1_i1:186-611(-)
MFMSSHKTWNLENMQPLHTESGFLRSPPTAPSNHLEFVVAQPTGVAEIEEGNFEVARNAETTKVEKVTIVLETKDTSSFIHVPTAKHPFVTKIRRRLTYFANNTESNSKAVVVEHILAEVEMATETVPELTLHLKAKWYRT